MTWHTPPRIAKQIGVSPEKVLAWINSGQLQAVNVAESPKGRPRWKVSQEALEAFLEARKSAPASVAPARQRARRYERPDNHEQLMKHSKAYRLIQELRQAT